jgi:hypothetical protein
VGRRVIGDSTVGGKGIQEGGLGEEGKRVVFKNESDNETERMAVRARVGGRVGGL